MSPAADSDSPLEARVPASRRVGVFGGTFDPPHAGHVAIAVAAIEVLALDELRVVVANDPYQKPQRPGAAASERLALARLAFATIELAVVDDRELRRGGPSYTIETVESIVAESVSTAIEVFVIVGADAARSLPTWHRADDLARAVTIAIVDRSGADDVGPAGFRCVKIPIVRVDVSSSEVRRRVAAGLPIGGTVPPAVIHEIRRLRLYTGSQ